MFNYLSPRKQKILEMRLIEGMTYKAIAEEFEVADYTIKRVIRRALEVVVSKDYVE